MALEYRSSAAWRGLPLVHVQFGTREPGGRYRPGRPRGVIAVGDIAVGAVAVGPVAVGVVAVGAAAFGIVTVGAAAVGMVTLGVAAVGVLAVGAAALGVFAIGVASLGWHAVGIVASSPSVLFGAIPRRTRSATRGCPADTAGGVVPVPSQAVDVHRFARRWSRTASARLHVELLSAAESRYGSTPLIVMASTWRSPAAQPPDGHAHDLDHDQGQQRDDRGLASDHRAWFPGRSCQAAMPKRMEPSRKYGDQR